MQQLPCNPTRPQISSLQLPHVCNRHAAHADATIVRQPCATGLPMSAQHQPEKVGGDCKEDVQQMEPKRTMTKQQPTIQEVMIMDK